jgi:hypothetical protein
MDMEFYISLLAFIVFLTISIKPPTRISIKPPIREKIDNYKSQKFYENTYLYHIPNSRIMEEFNY